MEVGTRWVCLAWRWGLGNSITLVLTMLHKEKKRKAENKAHDKESNSVCSISLSNIMSSSSITPHHL